MAAAKPWMKFYPRDWRADEKLRDCSLAARGLWIEMLSIMHASERYGRLLIAGKPPSAASLGRQVGASESEVSALLDELREADVFSTDAAGIIYSRRMKTDEKVAENARKHGKRGGNPKLCNINGKSALDKGEDNGADKGTHKPRGQSTDKKEYKEKRPQQIPDNWQPEPFGEGTEAGSIVKAWPDGELSRQLERFKDHHRAKGSRFSDWQAAWGTWVRNSVNFTRQPARPQSPRDEDRAYLERVIADNARREEWERAHGRPAAAGGTA